MSLECAASDVPYDNDNQHNHDHDNQGDDAEHGTALLLGLLCSHQLLDTLFNLQDHACEMHRSKDTPVVHIQ